MQHIEEISFIIHPSFGKEVEKMLLDIASSLGAIGKICYQEEPKGTAHAILCASTTLSGNVIVAFADTLFVADFNLDTCQEDFFEEMCEDIDFDLMYAINNSDEGFIDLILTLSELDEESDNMDLNFSEEEEIKDLIKKEPSWDVKIKNRVIL